MANYNWQDHHHDLISLVNGDFPLLQDNLIAEILPGMVFKKHAAGISSSYQKIEMKEISSKKSIHIHKSPKLNSAIEKTEQFLLKYVSDHIYTAFLHGSLATGEIVTYSDFDALVVIKNETLQNAGRLAYVCQKLSQCKKYMYQQDPLQHHGWFVLPEHALSDWPEYYMPTAVLNNASQIGNFGLDAIEMSTSINKCQNHKNLFNLLNAINSEITTQSGFTNIYRFKSMISKILLIPTFYLQAKTNVGVFKKDSFTKAENDFPPDLWIAIEAASLIRQKWPKVELVAPDILSERVGFIGDLIRKRASPKIPEELANIMSAAIQTSVLKLCDHIYTNFDEKSE